MLLAVFCSVAAAGYEAPSDTSRVELRIPAEAALDQFRNHSDFNYSRDVKYGKTFKEMINYYLSKVFRRLYNINGAETWLKWLWIVLLAGLAAFGISRMLGVDVSGIFYGKPPPDVDLADTVMNENMDRDQLGAMLEKVLNEKQYRLAVRLAYLLTLQCLSDAGQINRQTDKTNRAYLNEIDDPALRQPFANLTRLYEYVWYGDFDIHAEHYREMETGFDELKRRLR